MPLLSRIASICNYKIGNFNDMGSRSTLKPRQALLRKARPQFHRPTAIFFGHHIERFIRSYQCAIGSVSGKLGVNMHFLTGSMDDFLPVPLAVMPPGLLEFYKNIGIQSGRFQNAHFARCQSVMRKMIGALPGFRILGIEGVHIFI